MRNIMQLNKQELAELGEQVQESLRDLVKAYHDNGRCDDVINKELFAFEFTEGKKRQWLQATIGVISNPVYFHEDDATIHSWISTHKHFELTDEMLKTLLEMIDVLERNKIPVEIGKELIHIVEKNFIAVAQSLNNVK